MSVSKEKIATLRKDRGWTQEKLSAISGVSERTIQRTERDGTCSLDTKLALAAAFQVAPPELSDVGKKSNPDKVTTDLSGAFGLFVLGLATGCIVLITGLQGMWDVYSALLVLGLGTTMSIMAYGMRNIFRLFADTSWIVKYPAVVEGLPEKIAAAKNLIQNIYITGAVVALVTAISLSLYSPLLGIDEARYVNMVLRPLIYAVVLVEFWLRHYKVRMERMSMVQDAGR